MKITIETTHSEPLYAWKKEIEVPHDGQNLTEMFEMFAELLEGTYPGAVKFLEEE